MKTKTFARIGAAVMAFVTLAGYTMPAYAEVEDFIDKFAANNIMFYNPEECTGGSSEVSTIGGTAVISGSTSEEKIWSGLKSMGRSDEITAGIMGNMQGESGFSPARYEDSHRDVWESGFDWEHDPSSGYGVGLIQWSGSRRVTFFEDMRAKNNDLVEKYIKKPGTYGAMGGDAFIQAADSMAEAARPALLKIRILLLNLTPDAEDFSRRLGMACVLCAYVKRSSNLMLLAEREERADAKELALCLRESLDYLSACGVLCSLTEEGEGRIPLDGIRNAYAFFEETIESVLPDLSALVVNLSVERETITLRLMLDGPERVPEAEEIDGTFYRSFTAKEKRDDL